MPKVDTNIPYNQGGVFRAISNTYEDGSWITTYAYVEPECEPSRQSIQAHLVEIVKHSKNNGAHEQPNDPKLSHGAENRKREFAANLQTKEQPPLAPARC